MSKESGQFVYLMVKQTAQRTKAAHRHHPAQQHLITYLLFLEMILEDRVSVILFSAP